MLTSQGDLMEALTRLTRAVELMPSAAAVHYQIGVLYRRLGRTDEAERHLNAFRQLQADKAQQSGSAAK
jgi:Flp pilus assembly protein TadD